MVVMAYQFVYILFFNDPPTTDISTLSLHDALPISTRTPAGAAGSRSSTAATALRLANTIQPKERTAARAAVRGPGSAGVTLTAGHSSVGSPRLFSSRVKGPSLVSARVTTTGLRSGTRLTAPPRRATPARAR